MQIVTALACSECRRRNYSIRKKKESKSKKLELKKFCKFCRTHTLHKEVR